MPRKRSVTIDIVTDEKDAVRGLNRVRGAAQDTEKGFTKFGKGVKAAIGVVAAGAIGDFTMDMIRRGNQNEQVLARFNTVFGESAATVSAWAKSNAEAFGLSETELKGAVAAAGDLLVPLGFTRQEVARLAPDVLDMANAFSVFTGGQVTAEDAAQKVGKAILGEREGLKELGVVVSEADVKSRLAAKGQDKLTDAALAQAKALATLELIQERGADALDQYRREGAGALKEQRELEASTAELRDAVAQLATELTPLIGGFADLTSGIVDFFAKSSPDQVKELTARYRELGVAVDDTAVEIAVGSDHVELFTDLLSRAGFTMNDVVDAVAGGEAGIAEFRDRLEETARTTDLSSIELKALASIVDDVAEEHTEAAAAAREQAEAERRAGDQAELTDKQMQGLRDATTGVADATRDQIAAYDELANPALRAINAANNLRDAVQKVTAMQAAGNTNSAEYRDALLRLVEAQGRAAAASRTFAAEGGAQSITALIRLAELAGLSRSEIDQLVSAIGRLNSTSIQEKAARVVTTSSGVKLQAFDHGGIVGGPKGKPQVIVAHGGETVLPTHKNGAAMGMTVNIAVYPSAGMNEAQLARKVRDEQERWYRRGGLR